MDLRARGVPLTAIQAPWPDTTTTGARDLTLAQLEPHGHAVNVAVAAVLVQRQEAKRQRLTHGPVRYVLAAAPLREGFSNRSLRPAVG